MKRNYRTGLEIGPSHIAAAVVQRHARGLRLVKAACQEEDEPDTKLSKDRIERFLAENQLKAREMTVVLDDPSLYIRQVAVPRNLWRGAEDEIRWYFEQFLPHPLSKAAQSHYRCEFGFGGNDLAIIGVVFREAIEKTLEALDVGSIRVGKVDITPFALYRLFAANYELEKGRCIGIFDIDFDHGYGTIIKDGKIAMARRFSFRRSDDQENIVMAVEETLRGFENQFAQDVVDKVYFTRRSNMGSNHVASETEKKIREFSKVEVAGFDGGVKIETEGVDPETLQKAEVALGAALEEVQPGEMRSE